MSVKNDAYIWGADCSRFLNSGFAEKADRNATIEVCIDAIDVTLSPDTLFAPLDTFKHDGSLISHTQRHNWTTATPYGLSVESYSQGLTWNQRTTAHLFINDDGLLELRDDRQSYASGWPWNWSPDEQILANEGTRETLRATFAIEAGAFVLMDSHHLKNGEAVTHNGFEIVQQLLQGLKRTVAWQLSTAKTRPDRKGLLSVGAVIRAVAQGISAAKNRHEPSRAEVTIPTCGPDQYVECRCVEKDI